MKKPRGEAGLKDMMRDFGAPTTAPDGNPDAYTSSMFDVQKFRGKLRNVPRDVPYRVIPADTGFVSTSGLSVGSQARADYTCGRLWRKPETADHRIIPETQLPGSMNTQVVGRGLNLYEGGTIRKDMARPAVDE